MKKSYLLLVSLLFSSLSYGALTDFSAPEFFGEEHDLKGRINKINFIKENEKTITIIATKTLTVRPGNDKKNISLEGNELIRTEKRSARALTAEDLADYGITPTKLKEVFGTKYSGIDQFHIFANFKNGFNEESILDDGRTVRNAQFWVAVFPKDLDVKELMLQEEVFFMGVGSHFQLRFTTNKPILLLPQSSTPVKNWRITKKNDLSRRDIKDSKIFKMRKPVLMKGDFVYTLNAAKVVGGPTSWGIVEGGLGSFANALGFVSMYHLAIDQTADNIVKQYKMNLSAKKRKLVLETAISESIRKEENEIYHIFHNACHTASFEALYADGKGLQFNPYEEFNPYRIIKTFIDRGFVTKEKLPSLNTMYKSKVKSHKDFGQHALDEALKTEDAVKIDKAQKNRVKFVQTFENAVKFKKVLEHRIFDKLLVDVGNYILENNVSKNELAAMKEIMANPPIDETKVFITSQKYNASPAKVGQLLAGVEKEKVSIVEAANKITGLNMTPVEVSGILMQFLASYK